MSKKLKEIKEYHFDYGEFINRCGLEGDFVERISAGRNAFSRGEVIIQTGKWVKVEKE